jgi:hypothetical protein
MSRVSVLSALGALAALGCTSPPPPSQLPNGQAAIDRMRATTACGAGIQADAKVDHFSGSQRVRTELLFIAERPASIRMDVLAPVVGTVGTVTSDGSRFEATDLRSHRFLFGPATACNIARITRIQIPGFVLVNLLSGRAPVLKHDAQPTVAWSKEGYYVVKIAGNNDATEELHLGVVPEDWNKPWGEQRLRVLDVQVTQRGVVLYHAELDTHEKTPMSKAAACDEVCKATGETPAQPTGPVCEAELPRRIHVEMPSLSTDVLFRYDKIEWNPPLVPNVFTQQQPAGLTPMPVECED